MPDWTHTDLSLSARAERGERRAREADWSSGSLNDRVAELRAYLITSLAAQADLVGTTTTSAESVTLEPRPSVGVDPTRLAAARALSETWTTLTQGKTYPDQSLATVAVTYRPETGVLPVAAVIAIAIAATAATCYVAYQAADVIDRQLSRINKARELLQADETMVKLVSEHTEEERRQGKALPLSSATMQALDILRARQAELTKEQTKTDPSTPLTTAIKWGIAVVVAVIAWTELRRPARA